VQSINGTSAISSYEYPDALREDILRMVPSDGHVIGSVGCGFGNLEGVLVAAGRELKPGGWVLISVPNMRNIEVLMRLVFNGDWPEHPMGIFDRTHIQFMTHRRLKRWAAQAGLGLDHWVAYYHYLFLRRNIYRVVDRLTFGIFKSFLKFLIQGVFRLPHVPLQPGDEI
jgi:hypothetical protein